LKSQESRARGYEMG